MYYLDPLAVKVLLDTRWKPPTYQVDYPLPTRDLSRQAGTEPASRLARSSRWMLARLGGRLVALGERMERYGLPQHRPDLIGR
jgi:hypothetical protein